MSQIDMKNVLITGANKGIGFEIARQLGIQGHRIIIAVRNEQKMKEAIEKLKKEIDNVHGLLMDVSDEKSINRAAQEFTKQNLKLDVLVNNAGIGLKEDKSLLKDDDSFLTTSLITNSYGPLRVTKAFLPFFNKPGRVIMISSGGGSMSDEVGGWWPAYCTSKTLLNAITRQLAFDLRDENISVNAVCPGWVKTDMGGKSATRSVEEGAETPVWLATEAEQKLTGSFFRDKQQIPW
jgi:NAD(P)-dependent dehydrogenase (short-subunit alcohol dehydrogenase family)